MRKYGQYCPVARAAEILGDRWTLLIVRDLLYGVQHFNELERGLPRISRALLSERLRRLQRAGIIERHVTGRGNGTQYVLTEAGESLQGVVDALYEWSAAWCFGEPNPEDLDPFLVMWWLRAYAIPEQLPAQRTVIQFNMYGERTVTHWMVLHEGDVSICLGDPGFETNMLIEADIRALYHVVLGLQSCSSALHQGEMTLHGSPAQQRQFVAWFAWPDAPRHNSAGDAGSGVP